MKLYLLVPVVQINDHSREVWLPDIHHKINATQLRDTPLHSGSHALNLPDIHGPDPNHLGARPRRRDVLGHSLGLIDIAHNDGRCGAEMDQGADLRAANGARSACAEDHFVFWES